MEIEIHCDDDEILGGVEYQPCLELFIDRDHSISFSCRSLHSSENSTLATVWHGTERQYRNVLSQGALAIGSKAKISDLATKLTPLIERVIAGHNERWNGSNYVGCLTDDATEANQELQSLVDDLDSSLWIRDDVTAWDAGEWIADAAQDGVTATTSDAELEAIANEDEEDALLDGVLLYGSTLDARREARDELAAAEDE